MSNTSPPYSPGLRVSHAGMALIHEWRGEGLMRKMFSLRDS